MNQLKGKPFALIGVDVFRHEPKTLKAVMVKEKLNWRSFADSGEIVRQWNYPATPTFYVIDHQGIIRHKWVGHPGEKTIDLALKKLISVAEKNRP
ncbi:MAG: hypothetical protein CMO74_11680 [Verrucomicrobiales bacterium]|nr:hypothetical protein [Verrucomicrobiales bacterium]